MAGGLTPLRLDLRQLPTPEPMQRILDQLQTLPAGQLLLALTPLYPAPLLPILAQWGFVWHVHDTPDGGARIAICHASDRHLLDTPPAA